MGRNRQGFAALACAFAILAFANAHGQHLVRGDAQTVDSIPVGACGVETRVFIVNLETVPGSGTLHCCNPASNNFKPCGYPVTPKSFGAIGNGAANDTDAIGNFLAAGFTSLGPGNFGITDTIFLSAGQGLDGDGPGVTQITAIAGFSGTALIQDASADGQTDALFVMGLAVNCAGLSENGLVFEEETNIRIENVTVDDCEGAGIYLKDLTPEGDDGFGNGAYLANITITGCVTNTAAEYKGALWVEGWDFVYANGVTIEGNDDALADAGRRAGLLVSGGNHNHFSQFDISDHETGVAIVISPNNLPSKNNTFIAITTHDNQASGFLQEGTVLSPSVASCGDNHFSDSVSYHDGQSGDGEWCGWEIGGVGGNTFSNLHSASGGDAVYSSGFHFSNENRPHDRIGYIYGLTASGTYESPCNSDTTHVLPETGPDRCNRVRHHDSFRAGEVNEGDKNALNIWGTFLDNSGDLQYIGNFAHKFGRIIDEDIELRASFDNGISENSSKLLIMWDHSSQETQLPEAVTIQGSCDSGECRPAIIDHRTGSAPTPTLSKIWVKGLTGGQPADCIYINARTSAGSFTWNELMCGSDATDIYD